MTYFGFHATLLSLKEVACFVCIPGRIVWVRLIVGHWPEMAVFRFRQIVLACNVHRKLKFVMHIVQLESLIVVIMSRRSR